MTERGRKISRLILIPYGMLILFLLPVIGHGFLHPDSYGELREVFSAPAAAALLMIGVLLLLCLLLFLFRLLPSALTEQKEGAAEKAGHGICIPLAAAAAAGILLQLFLTLRYPLQIWWDNTSVLSSAVSAVYHMPEAFDSAYFDQVGHQNCFLFFTTLLVFAARLLHVPLKYLPLFCSLADLAAVDGSAALILYLTEKIKGRDAMRRLLILILLCPGMYLWCDYYYTTNMSLFFISLYFTLYYLALQKKRSIPFYLILGALAAFGSQFRATMLLCIVATFVYLLFHRPKAPVKTAVFSLIGALCMIFLLRFSYTKLIPDYDAQARFPVTHWIMMSFQGNGEYNDADVAFTTSFPTHEEKAKATREELLRRIKEMGPTGLAALFYRKTVHNWSYGNHSYYPMMSRYDRLTDLLWIPDHGFSFYLQQVWHLAVLIFVLAGTLAAIASYKKREGKISFDDLLRIFLLGGFCFYLFWETYPYYSVGFLTVLLYLSSDALTKAEKTARRLAGRDKAGLKTGKILLWAALSCGILFVFVKAPFPQKARPVVTQKKYHAMYYMKGTESLEQTFVADRGFDTIRFWITKEDLTKDTGGSYDIVLTGEKSGEVFRETYDTRPMHSIDEFTRTFPRVEVKGSERFTLRIEKSFGTGKREIGAEDESAEGKITDGSSENPLGIGAYDLPIKAYLRGSLFAGGKDTGWEMFLTVTDKGPDDVITLY